MVGRQPRSQGGVARADQAVDHGHVPRRQHLPVPGFARSEELDARCTISVCPRPRECPDFFEMPVEDEPGVTKWVWTGANGNYLVGTFDGKRFHSGSDDAGGQHGANYYAVQTYSDLPDERRVQLSWMKGGAYPGMPFNQQMSFPYELKLRKYGVSSYRIFALPAKEIESLWEPPRTWNNLELKPGRKSAGRNDGRFWDIAAEIEPATPSRLASRSGGGRSHTTCRKKRRSSATPNLSVGMAMQNGRIKLRILVDRASVEVSVSMARSSFRAASCPNRATKNWACMRPTARP